MKSHYETDDKLFIEENEFDVFNIDNNLGMTELIIKIKLAIKNYSC